MRQKRRDQRRQLRELPRAPPCGDSATSHTVESGPQPENPELPENDAIVGVELEKGRSEVIEDSVVAETVHAGPQEVLCNTQEVDPDKQEGAPTPGSSMTSNSPSASQPFLFKCLTNVKLEGAGELTEEDEEEGDVMVQMHWVEGLNRDLMNQLCTYLKNTLLRLASSPL